MALSFVHEVEAFVEKPDAETAAKYVADQYLWNSGNFLFSAATMWEEIEQLEPLMAEAAKASIAASTRDLDFLRLAPEPFARAPKKSIESRWRRQRYPGPRRLVRYAQQPGPL
jgi:mannose-1-phosphate guanylyltransferase / mannose-6-phosphate isomerase